MSIYSRVGMTLPKQTVPRIPFTLTLIDCDCAKGATLEWMAYRPYLKKGDRTNNYQFRAGVRIHL
jgi:hypothetical protein